jgi:hypothetical protein
MTMGVSKQKFCGFCQNYTRHERAESMSEGAGCLLIVLTGGLFLLPYIPYKLFVMMFPRYICHTCGRARGR